MRVSLLVTTLLSASLAHGSNINQNISQLVQKDPQLSKLKALISFAEARAAFDNLENATAFLPTNSAFEQLKVKSLNRLFANKDLARRLILAHVILGSKITKADLLKGKGPFPTASYGGSASGFDLFGVGYFVSGGDTFAGAAIDCDKDGEIGRFDRIGSPIVGVSDVELDSEVLVHFLDRADDEQRPQFLGLPCGILD